VKKAEEKPAVKEEKIETKPAEKKIVKKPVVKAEKKETEEK
jgi:hypothetical protein